MCRPKAHCGLLTAASGSNAARYSCAALISYAQQACHQTALPCSRPWRHGHTPSLLLVLQVGGSCSYESHALQVYVEHDDGFREGLTMATLSKLPAAFKKGGTTTAGNSSQVRSCQTGHSHAPGSPPQGVSAALLCPAVAPFNSDGCARLQSGLAARFGYRVVSAVSVAWQHAQR